MLTDTYCGEYTDWCISTSYNPTAKNPDCLFKSCVLPNSPYNSWFCPLTEFSCLSSEPKWGTFLRVEDEKCPEGLFVCVWGVGHFLFCAQCYLQFFLKSLVTIQSNTEETRWFIICFISFFVLQWNRVPEFRWAGNLKWKKSTTFPITSWHSNYHSNSRTYNLLIVTLCKLSTHLN